MKEIQKKIFIQEAVKKLINNMVNIRTVKDWAQIMHFSRSSFYSKFDKSQYSPKEVLKRHRYELILTHIKKNPRASSCEIAVKVGLSDSKAMYKFLNTHFDTTFSKLKTKVLKANYIDH